MKRIIVYIPVLNLHLLLNNRFYVVLRCECQFTFLPNDFTARWVTESKLRSCLYLQCPNIHIMQENSLPQKAFAKYVCLNRFYLCAATFCFHEIRIQDTIHVILTSCLYDINKDIRDAVTAV